jgi:hypothetical protein
MKVFLIYLALIAGQMNTLQDKPVVHLRPHQDLIPTEFGGDLVELVNAPAVIQLPKSAPITDSQGSPWSIDVKNLGPGTVEVVGKDEFSVHVNVGQMVHIYSNGTTYSLKR